MPASTSTPWPKGTNPSQRIDPVLGVMVMEFRGSASRLPRSGPSEPELRAYRRAQRIGLDLEPSAGIRR